MPRTCTICRHPARENIDSALVRRVSYRSIAERFSVSGASLSRHLNEHLADHVQAALTEYGKEKGIKVLDKLGSLVERLEVFLDQAEESEDGAEFRANAAELRRQLELIAKVQGDLAQEGAVNITLNQEWLTLKAVIVEALSPHPAALGSVLGALEASEAEKKGGNGRG